MAEKVAYFAHKEGLDAHARSAVLRNAVQDTNVTDDTDGI